MGTKGICDNCGQQIINEQLFCERCYTKLQADLAARDKEIARLRELLRDDLRNDVQVACNQVVRHAAMAKDFSDIRGKLNLAVQRVFDLAARAALEEQP